MHRRASAKLRSAFIFGRTLRLWKKRTRMKMRMKKRKRAMTTALSVRRVCWLPTLLRAVCACVLTGSREAWGHMLEKSFRNALGGSFKEKDFVHVDMGQRLAELGLVATFPSEAWPPHNAVRELATKIKRESKGSGTEFFIAADLRK